ncbi:hypothetical protein CoNPh17_CDS0120 [Staphylococcus phage S-CoN_Ph17]|nr:hypothetical protein CoNPh17_CDS0120 [Staphylococcus phage S-CoN_Ph17]
MTNSGKIKNVYKQLDYDWEEKGNMHKRHLFQESVKDNDGSQEISHFIKSTEKLFEELASNESSRYCQ